MAALWWKQRHLVESHHSQVRDNKAGTQDTLLMVSPHFPRGWRRVLGLRTGELRLEYDNKSSQVHVFILHVFFLDQPSFVLHLSKQLARQGGTACHLRTEGQRVGIWGQLYSRASWENAPFLRFIFPCLSSTVKWFEDQDWWVGLGWGGSAQEADLMAAV